MNVLSLFVFPLTIWGIRLEVRTTIQEEKIRELQAEVSKLNAVKEEVQVHSLTLIRLEGKLDNANEKVNEVRKILRNR